MSDFDLVLGIGFLVVGILMITIGTHKEWWDVDPDLREKVELALECCQTDEFGDYEHCKECPYNEMSIFVDDCRTKLSQDALEVIRGD